MGEGHETKVGVRGGARAKGRSMGEGHEKRGGVRGGACGRGMRQGEGHCTLTSPLLEHETALLPS